MDDRPAVPAQSRRGLRLVHLSDVHLGPLPPIPPAELTGKRAFGLLNWYLRRRSVHRPEVADALRRDAVGLDADHIVVTGDLANVGLPVEIERGARWLEGLGPSERVSVVPGNHDIYGTVGGRVLGVAGVTAWSPHFQSSIAGKQYGPDTPFPFVRIVANAEVRVALIGLNSAVETPPRVATGQIGAAQLSALARALDQTGADGLVRVVALHHPPLPGLADDRHHLIDAPALAEVLGAHGAELVVFGHLHRRIVAWHPTSTGPLPCVGVPSASAARPYREDPPARLHLFEFERNSSGGLVVTLVGRGLAAAGHSVVEVERRVLVGLSGLPGGETSAA